MTDYVAEARKLRVSIVQLARYAPDEVAATAAFAFEPWDPNSAYEAGDRVQYADVLYKCLKMCIRDRFRPSLLSGTH